MKGKDGNDKIILTRSRQERRTQNTDTQKIGQVRQRQDSYTQAVQVRQRQDSYTQAGQVRQRQDSYAQAGHVRLRQYSH